MDNLYVLLMQAAIAVLGLCLFVCLFRAVKGPSTSDRIVAINMTGTFTITIILFLSLLLKEDYLVDIALIYAMLSFLAVVLLCRIYIGRHRAKKAKEGKADA
ncbi:MAG: sodium:proton antiporter [Clostridia bacterium]|nr:sodium:proton antiporter [Clostridia bacterium]